MNEANPYIERFSDMNPLELDRQMDIAKALLPDLSILLGLVHDTDAPITERAVTFSHMYNRRENSEARQRGLMILDGLKPRMVVTTHLKDLLDPAYMVAFNLGVRAEEKGKHLLEILFYDAKFPKDIALVGAVFIPERSAPLEATIFRSILVHEQETRDLFIEMFGRSEERRDSVHDETAKWLKQMRELHGQDIV